MTLASPGVAANPLEAQRDRMRDTYGEAIGRHVDDLVTPALVLDLPAAERNIARMAAELATLPSGIRPHIKVHKSAELAARQVEAGALGLSVATVWEAVALAWAGLDDLFVVNTVAHPEKLRVLAELARRRRIIVAVDQAENAATLAAAARRAGSRLSVLIEVDTGMDRAGVDSEAEAVELARAVLALPELELEGLTGYEGHCSAEQDGAKRTAKQRQAMDFFLSVADRFAALGLPDAIRSAGGTGTWRLTAAREGITEIQAGTYVVMDSWHAGMAPEYEHALTVACNVISRPPGRLIVDAGFKSVGTGGGPTMLGSDLEVLRFDEEHGVFIVGDDAAAAPPVGAPVRLVPGYAPATTNMYDCYHVVADDRVVDIWPVFPRGPGHNGLLEALPEE
jgi:D-serine deaminase-like pyridoxal phosphate-dependent protein